MKFTIGEGEKQLLIIGHFDTVWEKGRLSLRTEGNKLYGPGILDMKGGIIQSIWAIKAIQELGLSLDKNCVFAIQMKRLDQFPLKIYRRRSTKK